MSDPLRHEDLAAYAHELRGALTVIAGYAELLRRQLPLQERDRALDGIERAILRADALCSDALAGRTPSSASRTFAPVSLCVLAEQVAADQRSATGRAIDVVITGSADVLGDADSLARVLGNLIDNAAKYSPTRTPIEVRVGEEEGAMGTVSFVEVSDRGPGISDEELARVVEPFARLERDADIPGTGLGLGIVNNVIAMHNGRLNVSERNGGGAIVRLELPRA